MSINQTKPAGELHNWELNSLTTNAGASVDNAKMSQTLGPRGPVLLQDFALIESLQVQNRERIPERVVHARGMTVKGEFTCTDDVSDLTIADFLQTPGKTTKLAARLSTVIHSKDSPEYLRDVRGFALKLYTQQGNYDMVGNVWPVFFVRDGIRFPEMVRALKPNPRTNNQEWWRIWDFFSNYPESTHAFTFLLDDIGIPKSYRHLNGFSINTYKMVNAQGRETFFRWRIESELGEVGQLDEEACKQNFSAHSRDLMDAIDRGEFPKYNFFIQTMTEDQFPTTFDPLDATKDWPLDQFPKRKIGEMIFNENIDGFFAESESIAFAPSRMVPGIEPSDDKLLQSRLFAYADTQTYRLGINNQMLPINAPQCPFRDSHVDGVMHFRKNSRGSRAVNYFPSTLHPEVTESKPLPHERYCFAQPLIVREDPPRFNDFEQAGNRWRSFSPERQQRFADRVALSLTGSMIPEELRKIWLDYWYEVDPNLNHMIIESLALLVEGVKPDDSESKIARFKSLETLKEAFALTSARSL